MYGSPGADHRTEEPKLSGTLSRKLPEDLALGNRDRNARFYLDTVKRAILAIPEDCNIVMALRRGRVKTVALQRGRTKPLLYKSEELRAQAVVGASGPPSKPVH